MATAVIKEAPAKKTSKPRAKKAVAAKAGTPVAICEYDSKGTPIGFATGIAGKDCPADTWLVAKNGKLVANG